MLPCQIPMAVNQGALFRHVLILLSPSSRRAEFDACHYLRVSRLLHLFFSRGMGERGLPRRIIRGSRSTLRGLPLSSFYDAERSPNLLKFITTLSAVVDAY